MRPQRSLKRRRLTTRWVVETSGLHLAGAELALAVQVPAGAASQGASAASSLPVAEILASDSVSVWQPQARYDSCSRPCWTVWAQE